METINPFIDILSYRNKSIKKETKSNTISPQAGLIAYGTMASIGIGMGSAIGTYVFFGTITLSGIILVVESQPLLKRLAVKSNKVIDLSILVASIYATASLGVTVAASLTVAGIGYSLIYSPYLRASKQ